MCRGALRQRAGHPGGLKSTVCWTGHGMELGKVGDAASVSVIVPVCMGAIQIIV